MDSLNPYSSFSVFLDEMESFNDNQRKSWNEWKQKSQSEMERVLSLLGETAKDRDEEIQRLRSQKEREIDALNEKISEYERAMNALKSERKAMIKKLEEPKRTDSAKNEDKLIEKLQDILLILYRELKPEKQSLGDHEEIRKAFKDWKQRERRRIKEEYEQQQQPKNEEMDVHGQYTSYSDTKGLASLMVYLKDF